MTSAGLSSGPVALQRLGWSFAPPSVGLWCLSAREGKINGFVSFHLCVDTGSWCVGRHGDDFVTCNLVVSCGGRAWTSLPAHPFCGTEGSKWAQEETWSFSGLILCSAHREHE